MSFEKGNRMSAIQTTFHEGQCWLSSSLIKAGTQIVRAARSVLVASVCALLAFTASPTQAQTAKPMSVLLGSKGEGTTTDTITDSTGSYINANRFQAQASGNTKRISAKINAIQGKYQVAIYTDRSGQPNRLIATSSEVSPKSNGWHSFPLATQVSLTKGRSYWIAIWSNDTNARVFATNNGVLRWNNIPYSPNWPTSLTLPTSGNYTYSIYAESSGSAAAIPPIVKLTAPLDDASYTAGSNINIVATATDSDGTIAKVEFFAGSSNNTNTKVGEKTQAPWTMMWTNVAAGNYAITAKATDSQGLMSTSEPADITVSAAPPPPPPPPPPPTNQAPTVSLTAPANNSSVNVNTAVNITANAADADGMIAKVEFFASVNGTNTKLGEDTVAPYTFAWTPTTAGTYAITARATDDKGATTTSSPIIVIVNVVVTPPPPPPPPTNQAPTVNLTAPTIGASVAAGTTVNIAANATDADGTINKVEFFASLNSTNTKLGEDTTAPYTFAWTPTAAGTYTITARATDDKGATTTSTSISVTITAAVIPPPPVASSDFPANDAEAARFLVQATFGPTSAEIARLRQIGYSAWIDDQLTKPASRMKAFMDSVNDPYNDDLLLYGWWHSALGTNDQLRQRIAFALSQIFVVSTQNNDIRGYRTLGLPDYYDVLVTGASGSYRALLENVTLHPMMGLYLSHLGNKKEDPVSGVRADENYAREVMQLFSIGLNELNIDGTPKLINGNTISTYAKADVEGLAKVFTGWGWNYPRDDYFWDTTNTGFVFKETQSKPMMAVSRFHSTSEKKFLGVTIAPQTTPNPQASLKTALDRLATHPNTAPFIVKQLIKHLVTSNPSPAYIARVATAFNNSSGSLGATVRAILLDPEARNSDAANSPTFGRLREPLMRLTHFARAMGLTSASGFYAVGYKETPGDPDAGVAIGQDPLNSPSVFNYYRPGYVPPNTSIAAVGLVAPTFQIFNEISTGTWVDAAQIAVEQGFGATCCNLFYNRDITTKYTPEIALADQPTALVDRLNTLLLSGQISSVLRADVIAGINSIAIPSSNAASIADAKRRRVQMAVFLMMISPEYLVQK
jgi:endo-chitodextinase